jgi:hypothetical protein
MKNIIGTKYNIWIYTKNEDLTNVLMRWLKTLKVNCRLDEHNQRR